MKILVISDTHGAIQPMLEVLAREQKVQVCIHLGDGIDKMPLVQAKYKMLTFFVVHGNCDHFQSAKQELIFPLEDRLFYITHGDCFHVKQGYHLLWESAHMHKADIALFGHTHKPFYEFKNGIHLFNPGSLGKPPVGVKPSYGLIYLEKNQLPTFDILFL